MSLLASKYPTLADVVKLKNADGTWAKPVDMMRQANEILDVMTWAECNMGDQHMVLQEVSLPAVSEAMYNRGIAPTDGKDDNIYFPTATSRSWQEIDADIAEQMGDPAGLMAMRSRKHRAAHARNFVNKLFYGNSLTDPDTFPGLGQFFGDSSASNGQNIIKCGGSGSDNASIWLIAFGEDAFTGIYPKNTVAGLKTEDKGLVTKENADGTTDALRDVYRAKFSWHAGIAIPDWKWVARLCNIDVSDILAQNDAAADLLQATEDALYCLPSTAVMTDANLNGRRMGWFMNRTMRKMIDRQSRKAVQGGGQLDYVVVDGVRRKALHGIPMYTVDQLTNAETAVS